MNETGVRFPFYILHKKHGVVGILSVITGGDNYQQP